MQLKNLSNNSLFIVTIMVMGFFSIAFFDLFIESIYEKSILLTNNDVPRYLIDTNFIKSTVQAILPVKETSTMLSIHLRIPKIRVDAALESVGITSDGAMDVPGGPTHAAWFNLGSYPGEVGSAVLPGHFGWKNGIPAVFDHLDRLENGDKIYIEDNKGATDTFVVQEIRSFDANADARDVFDSNDGKSHLNLITCEGAWNKMEKSYSNRLVVFADKEIE